MHLDEDTLLKLSLQILDQNELENAELHLRDCSVCAQRFSLLHGEVAELGTVRTETRVLPMPQRKRTILWNRSYLRAAALLFIGIGIGTIATWSSLKRPPIVLPCTIIKQIPADSVAHVVFSDDTEVRFF